MNLFPSLDALSFGTPASLGPLMFRRSAASREAKEAGGAPSGVPGGMQGAKARANTMPCMTPGTDEHAVKLQALARGRSARRLADSLREGAAAQKMVAMELVSCPTARSRARPRRLAALPSARRLALTLSLSRALSRARSSRRSSST